MECRDRKRLCFSCLISSVLLELLFVLFCVVYLHVFRMSQSYVILDKNITQDELHSQNEEKLNLVPTKKTKTHSKSEEMDADEFLKKFEAFCKRKTVIFPPNNTFPPCPCIPRHLVGQTPIQMWAPPFGELEIIHPELLPGGRWRPRDCVSRHRVAVIVPFRDRQNHLRIFLQRIHPILQRQELDYQVFVVEQAFPKIFNKAMMMNIGFTEAQKMYRFDCFVFHDVDMLPEDDRNIYACSEMPRHVGSHCDKWDYKVPYKDIFGGAISLNPQQFQSVNGFSNEFYGWGGEDDDMYRRVVSRKYKVVRYPGSVARYTMIKHKRDTGNPYNSNSAIAWKWRPKHYTMDGLNTLQYKRLKLELRPLYTWIYSEVAAPPPPPPRKEENKAGLSVFSNTASWTFPFVTYWGAILSCVAVCFYKSIVTLCCR